MTEKKDLMPKEEISAFIIPATQDLGLAMQEELQGLPVSLIRVKIPTGGATTFEIPITEDEPEIVKEIEGVIIDHYPVNALWPNKFDGKVQNPECYSLDGKIGVGNPGGSCATCPFNKFGSAEDGIGKKCKNMHRVYIIRSGEFVPLLITLPPTSLKNFSDYLFKRLLQKGLRSYQVITKITLKKAQNSSGIAYSQAQFSLVRPLTEDEVKQAVAFAASIRTLTRQMMIDDEDYNVGNNETSTDYDNATRNECPF